MKTIKCVINKQTGKLTIETQGFQGAECLEGAAAELEKGLGMTKEGSCSLTDEYYQQKQEGSQEVGGA